MFEQDNDEAAPACAFCGELERIGLFEVWDRHEFAFETCQRTR